MYIYNECIFIFYNNVIFVLFWPAALRRQRVFSSTFGCGANKAAMGTWLSMYVWMSAELRGGARRIKRP